MALGTPGVQPTTVSNTNAVTVTDRTALGAQPDGTPASNTGGGSGVTKIIAGTNVTISPTSGVGNVTVNANAAAGITQLTGDVTAGPGSGSQAATLAASGVAVGTYGDATHSVTATVDAKGRLTTLVQQLITWLIPSGGGKYARLAKNSATNGDVGWYGPDWFNVKDYGAKGDGTTDDTTNINNAGAALVANGGGTLYFPDGTYKTTAAITFALSVQTACIRGNSKNSSIILCSTNSINAIYVDCSGGSDRRLNRVEVCHLGFRTPSSIAPTCAVYVDYGSTVISSSENQNGSWVHNLDIWNNSSNSGGYIYGVIMRSCWHSRVTDIYGYGNSSTYSAASTPGAGDGGAGSGALIRYLSGTNFAIDRVGADFWGQGIRIEPITGADAYTPQGVSINNFNIVEAIEGIHYYTNTSGGGPDYLAISNVQVDQGNVNLSTHVGLYLEGSGGGTDVYVSNSLFLLNNGVACIKLNGINTSLFNAVSCAFATNKPTYGLQVTGVSNVNRFSETCQWDGLPINFGASTGLSYCRNTSPSVITNSGSNNIFGDTKQFPSVQTPTATATYSFSVNISSVGLAAAPVSAFAEVITSLPNDIICRYDFNNVGNTATTAFFLISRSGGANLVAAAIRFCIEVPAQ